ncbi:MAG: GNAT family N-acetyltransferase [Treponema sp.]|nr:GNAT family N-acetyltransferase [Treponema sp.]
MKKNIRWRKINREEYAGVEQFLRAREFYCVSACARYLRLLREGPGRDHIWGLQDPGGKLAALLIYSRRSLFPVFGPLRNIPLPGLLKSFPGKAPVHMVQGLRPDVELLEPLMEEQGYQAAESIDYDLMMLEGPPNQEILGAGPPDLVLRPPMEPELDEIAKIQGAYEKEEVLPKGAVFNGAYSHTNLEHILAEEKVLIALLGARIVGKINTNAESFNCSQIGGVYVLPELRRRGIALKMSAVFLSRIIADKQKIVLFVKKKNAPARRVYRRLGFTPLGDYRIIYY